MSRTRKRTDEKGRRDPLAEFADYTRIIDLRTWILEETVVFRKAVQGFGSTIFAAVGQSGGPLSHDSRVANICYRFLLHICTNTPEQSRLGGALNLPLYFNKGCRNCFDPCIHFFGENEACYQERREASIKKKMKRTPQMD